VGAKATAAAVFVGSHPEIAQAGQGFSDGVLDGYANVSTQDHPYAAYMFGKKLGKVVGTAAGVAEALFH